MQCQEVPRPTSNHARLICSTDAGLEDDIQLPHIYRLDFSKAVRDAQSNADLQPLIVGAGHFELCISCCESYAAMHVYLTRQSLVAVHYAEIIQDSSETKEGGRLENVHRAAGLHALSSLKR